MLTYQPPTPALPAVAGNLDFEALLARLSARLLATWPEGIESIVIGVLDDVRVFFGADRGGLLSVDFSGRASRVVAGSARATSRGA